MSSQAKAGAVIYAKDFSRVSDFYAGVVGFEVAHSEADHVVLESRAFQLVVLSIPPAITSSIEITRPPLVRTETPIKLVFFVISISASREAAVRLGGQLNPAEREWRFQQATVCDGHDPEGNVFQLREMAG
jgi:predicted enzyme related to lactoylglutathione lyase